MGLFNSLFGKKKQAPSAAPQPEFQPTPEQQKQLDYMDVRRIEDPAKRVPLMMKFAEEGDELALYEMGELYLFGRDGVEQNIEKGKQYLYEGGQKGATNATAMLAMFCIKQAFAEVSKDKLSADSQEECIKRFWDHYNEGVGHLAWAISKGNATAMDILTGNMSLGWNEGDWASTLVRETSIALEPYLAELKAEDTAESNYVLGILSMRSIALPQDFAAARTYLERSAAQGHQNAKKELENPLLAADDDEDDED